MMSLKHRAVSGIKWSAISQFGRQGTQVLTTIILARLLSPADFGLLGLAMVIVGFLSIFKDLGTGTAIIQQKELPKTLLPSLFWINAGFGALAMLSLLLLAPLGGAFYQEAQVTDILRVLSVSFFLSGLGIVHQAVFERSLAFDALARVEISSVVIGALVGIGLAIRGSGVWSLVFQSLTTTLVSTALLWLSSPWRPRWVFHWNEVKIVTSFSLNLTGFSIFNYFARNADYLLIGRFLGAQELGYYTLAYRILLFPLQNISAVVGRVLYPVLSTMQEDNNRFASAYLRVIRGVAFISFPLMTGVFVLAKPFVLAFFGQNWEPVILLIMILAPVGLVQSIGATVGAIYQAKGKTDWMLRWGIGTGVLTVIAFLCGLPWGVAGVAGAYAIASLFFIYPGFSIPFRLIDLKFIHMLRELRLALLGRGMMLAALLVFNAATLTGFPNDSNLNLVISVIIGVAVYSSFNWIANRGQVMEFLELAGLKQRAHEQG